MAKKTDASPGFDMTAGYFVHVFNHWDGDRESAGERKEF